MTAADADFILASVLFTLALALTLAGIWWEMFGRHDCRIGRCDQCETPTLNLVGRLCRGCWVGVRDE